MNQQCLFNEEINIPGLAYTPNYISSEHEEKLLKLIDTYEWSASLKRRTQHYGYAYDYGRKSARQDHFLGPMPAWLAVLCAQLSGGGFFTQQPDQVIINEYQPGQGIAPHIDCVRSFGGTIASLSLAAGCMMEFSRDGATRSIYLEPQSLLILQGEARFYWRHGIAARKKDGSLLRQRRISVTFRRVLV